MTSIARLTRSLKPAELSGLRHGRKAKITTVGNIAVSGREHKSSRNTPFVHGDLQKSMITVTGKPRICSSYYLWP